MPKTGLACPVEYVITHFRLGRLANASVTHYLVNGFAALQTPAFPLDRA